MEANITVPTAGQSIVYHTGYLGKDSLYDRQSYENAKFAYRTYCNGWVELTQRKIGFQRYEYIMTSRHKNRRPIEFEYPKFLEPKKQLEKIVHDQ